MAFLLPIDEIREVARDVGLGAVDVESRQLTDAIRVTRADGQWVDLDADIFAGATRATWEPLRRNWEPLVRRELVALSKRSKAYAIVLRRADGTETTRASRSLARRLIVPYVTASGAPAQWTFELVEVTRDTNDQTRVAGAIYAEVP